ncbi:hypothetical protein K2173_019706 [Erythroxylum novogranatense]|uniref:Uncharacterized protein n=1 Tax=Erythroxylum novogranatense TaxID=1862640 RepID=A0AAV8SM07_9ROSI|nr:hypothetical protein K2173_019706 [Erythroxylum novogranatense]
MCFVFSSSYSNLLSTAKPSIYADPCSPPNETHSSSFVFEQLDRLFSCFLVSLVCCLKDIKGTQQFESLHWPQFLRFAHVILVERKDYGSKYEASVNEAGENEAGEIEKCTHTATTAYRGAAASYLDAQLVYY